MIFASCAMTLYTTVTPAISNGTCIDIEPDTGCSTV